MKVLIAEDERLAREELMYLLQKETDVQLLPVATNGRELIEMASLYLPDVIFADIRMPEMLGTEAVRKLDLKRWQPIVVFTTAYEHYALEAFELEAADYLLKPYDEMRLQDTMKRIRQRLRLAVPHHPEPPVPIIAQAEPALEPQTPMGNRKQGGVLGKLLIDDGEKVVVLNTDQFMYAEKEEKSVVIVTAGGATYTSKMTLQELEEKLPGLPLFRPHRSYLINLRYVEELIPWFNGAYNIKVKYGGPIPVSRQSAKELFRLLGGE